MNDTNLMAKEQQDTCRSTDAELSFNSTLKVLGDFWTLRVVGALEHGSLRFCEIERSLQDSNPATLTSRLKKLETHKYVVRTEEAVDKQSVSYGLTQNGLRVLPIVNAMRDLSQKT